MNKDWYRAEGAIVWTLHYNISLFLLFSKPFVTDKQPRD